MLHITVGDRVHQALASLRSAKADMESFSLETKDKDAKQLFADSAEQIGQIVESISGRVNYIEEEEPTYKMNNNNR